MKFLRICFLIAVLLATAVPGALAYTDKATIAEEAGSDFVRIERLALAAPLYMPVREAPSREELQQILDTQPTVTKRQIVTYEAVVQNIARDKGVDIRTKDRHVAAKLFRDNVGQYADAYVLLTIANSSRACFYFDIFQAGTNRLLYFYQLITDTDEKEDVKTYTMLVNQFYKALDASIQEEIKAQEKKARDAAREKEKKDAKRQENK